MRGTHFIISTKYCICFSEVRFFLANSADADELPCSVTFHLGLLCLQNRPVSKEFPVYELKLLQYICYYYSNNNNSYYHYYFFFYKLYSSFDLRRIKD